MSFSDVRTYWVENAEVTRALGGTNGLAAIALGSIATAAPDVLANDLCKEILRLKAAGSRPVTDFTKRRFGGMIITRVFLTRQITYTYSNAKIIAAGVRRAEAGSTAANVPDPARVSVNVNSTTGELDSAEIDKQIAEMRTQLDALGNQDSQGAGVNFESWDALGLTFSQNFPRPVTIGYEAINFGLQVPPDSVFARLQEGDKTICPGIAN